MVGWLGENTLRPSWSLSHQVSPRSTACQLLPSMKDNSRPHPSSPSRSAPYRKRKSSGNRISPARGTRRPYDASQNRASGTISPSDRARSSRHDEAQSSRDSFAGNERRSLSKPGEHRAVSHTRRHASMDGSMRERPSALGTHADVPGPFLRLPLTSVPPTGQKTPGSPTPGSVTAFLRSIELPDKPPCAPPPLQTSISLAPPSLRLPPLSTDNMNKAACTNRNDYQVSLVCKGYPFTYDLSALPDDPEGAIALLTITKSDPGAYLLVAAHYRRTGRSRAARAVIRSLLDNLDEGSDGEKDKGDGTLRARLRTLLV